MMPDRLTEFGPNERPDHFHLPADAACWFWGEYTPYEHTGGKNWNYSPTNQLIANFKKKMDRRGHAGWHYKGEAIEQAAVAFARFFAWTEMHERHKVALMPVPPSRARNDPMYDPRVLQMLERVAHHVGLALDIRDCLSFSGRYGASHLNDVRPTPDELHDELAFDPLVGRAEQLPGSILVFDDVVTAGAHYASVSRKLKEAFPGVPIYGSFIARRVLPNPFADIV